MQNIFPHKVFKLRPWPSTLEKSWLWVMMGYGLRIDLVIITQNGVSHELNMKQSRMKLKPKAK